MLNYHATAPGSWLVAVLADSVFAVQASAAQPGPHPSPDALLDALAADGVQSALEFVTARGLGQTPPFVLVRRSGAAVRCIVRGAAVVAVSTPSGEATISGAHVDTWLEQSIGDASSYSIDLGGGDSAREPAALLRIDSGTVWADLVVSGVSSATGSQRATVAKQPVADAELSEHTLSDTTVAAPPDPSDQSVATTLGAVAPSGEYDHLFGATVARSVEAAAVRPADPEADEDAAAGTIPAAQDQPGDHDGLTVMSGDLHKLRSGRTGGKPPARVPDPSPTFGLELANGVVEPIGGPVIVGRAPSVTKAPGSEVPRLVTVDSADHDISRNHVRFTVEGDTVVVTDLHSRNGTSVVLPGKPPQKLRQGEPTSVIADTVIDLGSGVTMTVRQGVSAPKK